MTTNGSTSYRLDITEDRRCSLCGREWLPKVYYKTHRGVAMCQCAQPLPDDRPSRTHWDGEGWVPRPSADQSAEVLVRFE